MILGGALIGKFLGRVLGFGLGDVNGNFSFV